MIIVKGTGFAASIRKALTSSESWMGDRLKRSPSFCDVEAHVLKSITVINPKFQVWG